MTRYFESVLGRSPRPEFDMVASVFLLCFGESVGAIIISVYTAFIAWKGLICAANGHDVTEHQLIA